MYCIVVPFDKSLDEVGFTYKINDTYSTNILGKIVNIPFGKTNILGVVVKIVSDTDFDKQKIKQVGEIFFEKQILLDYQIELVNWLAKNYFCLIHQALSLFLQKDIISKISKQKFLNSPSKDISYTFNYKKELSLNQNKVFLEIFNSNEKKFFLYGVTGSGKTEIYINLIKKYIDLGKQVLLLVPEIILTSQIFERIQEIFSKEVVIINSTVSQGKKTNYRQQIYNNEIKIVVSTRSGIFYPYSNLGLIIIDEEHDNSYISDVSPRYDSIEVCEKISELTGCKLVLGSGTPKINHMYKFIKNKNVILNLFNEFE